MRLYDELKTKNLKLLGKIQQLQSNVQVCFSLFFLCLDGGLIWYVGRAGGCSTKYLHLRIIFCECPAYRFTFFFSLHLNKISFFQSAQSL